MSPSTKIIFNNQMDDFSTPESTNIYGIPPSKNNFIMPNKRPMSSMTPSILVDKNNKVKLIVGASGGPRIISAVSYVSTIVFRSITASQKKDTPAYRAYNVSPM